MIKKHKYDLIVILALVGFAISFYLTISHYWGFAVPCNVTHGCETVLSSKYSIFLGLPLAVWGVAYFTAVILASLMANHYLAWKKTLTVLLGLGGLASLVFLSLQFFVIKKVCQYCFTTDLLSILLFILDINIEHKT